MPVDLNAETGSGHTSAYYEDRLHVIFPHLNPTDLIQRSRANHGVSKDGCGHGLAWPSFETRARARSSGRGPIDDIDMIPTLETVCRIAPVGRAMTSQVSIRANRALNGI